MLTPIGTGLNLLVIGTAAGLGVPRFGMFDFALPAAIGASVGLAYLWLVAPKLLPDRETQFVDVSPRVFHGVLHINEDSVANGKTIAEILESTAGQMKIRRIQRGADLTLTPLPSAVLRAGDRVFVDDKPENLKEFEALLGATLHNEDEVEGGKVTEEHPLKTPNQQLAEIIVTENSPFAHRTLGQAGFTDRYELVPLALHRAARNAATGKVLTDEVMRVGDVLLVQGSAEELAKVKSGGELLVLDATTDLPYTERAGFATVIMISIVVLASTKLLPVSVAALVGVVMMIVAGCMTWRDAIRALDAAVIFLTAASLALSLALMKTGGAEYLAQSVASLGGVLSPFWILSLLILVMAIFANVVSNTSAAVIGTPIAVSIAHLLGQPPEPFVLAVLFGANMGFCTPMADNCNLLVFSAGGYHFNDFVRVGVPLTLLMWLTFSFVLPRFYPLG
jgi:di/tricarboxylate transporter